MWRRLGEPTVYVEPCAGSLAVLLASPAGAADREIICDTDGFICNFWRAVQHAPRTVARWADYPTIHQDLTARHRWLVDWSERNTGRLVEDPEWFDAKAAGWWVWGLSIWIGSGWCTNPDARRPHANPGGGRGINRQRLRRPWEQRPYVADHVGGQGVSRQTLPADDKVPHCSPKTGGRGISRQRLFDKRPFVHNSLGGRGVSVQRRGLANGRRISHLDNLVGTFDLLGERLGDAIVLNRSWESAVTPTLLQHTPASSRPVVAIFFDPPYMTAHRHQIYKSDVDRTSDAVAQAIYVWMLTPGSVTAYPELAPGDVYRIAYCCGEGDFPLPPGWTAETETFAGIRSQERRARRDMIMYSPACLNMQPTLFDAAGVPAGGNGIPSAAVPPVGLSAV